MIKRIKHALGIGRKVDPVPPRRMSHRYAPGWLGDHISLSPWSHRFRFGWVLVIVGPYKHTGIGVVGPDWEDGDWLGGGSWKRHGPVAVCRWGRRGSWRGDRRFRRMMQEERP